MLPARLLPAHRRSRGQALPLGVLLLAVLALAWTHGYGLRQVANARTRLAHVADVVAYSGALSQARSLNLAAWISRTQLAHQIAMGHVATLAAWADFGSRQAEQQARGNPPAFLIASLFGPRYGTAYRAAGTLLAGAQSEGWAAAYARHDSLIHDVLEQVRGQTLSRIAETRQAVMTWVMQQNLHGDYSGLAGSLARDHARLSLYADTLPGAIGSQRAEVGQGGHAWLTQQIRNTPFLAPRNETARNHYLVSPYCPHLRHELRRRGTTTLDADGRWQALDTLSFKALRRNRWVGCYFRPYPMGWAWAAPAGARPGAMHTQGAPSHFGDEAFWRWLQDKTNWPLLGRQDNPLATSYAAAAPLALRSRGLTPDVAIQAGRLQFSIGLAVPAHTLQTANAASRVALAGDWRFQALQAEDWLQVQSAAAVEYVRPHGKHGVALEAANLYLPYWQARLAPGNAAALHQGAQP
ncbi:hypothetical protein [Kerstersia similis]|uniref:hypothetical protein n=1 Tax=Kerstersia similis TaxID=206505 RepID=UPI0039F04DDD